MPDREEHDKEHTAQAVPLAIVGIGCLFPGAGDLRSYWINIREGVDAISDVPDSHWSPQDYFDADQHAPDMTYARRGGFLSPVEFDPLLYGLSPNNIEATDSTQLLGMVVARQALLDGGYATAKDADDGRQFDRDRTCVILGVTGTLELVIPLGARLGHPIWRRALADAGVDKDTADDVVERIAEGYVPWQENSFPGLLGNVAAGRIANRFDLGGTNCVVDAACASSLSAVHMAAMELQAGRADMAITGGFDTFNDIFMYMCFSKTPALSPTGNSKPFDDQGDGTILGEGLGAVILKRLDDARRDGDKVYAVLKGMGSSSDGRGNAIYAPSAEGQTKALRRAYRQAEVSPRTIELVEAHGTGTKVGDAVEAQALSAVYRDADPEGCWCAIGSVKSMIGHTKAAAGIAGLIKVAMALHEKTLPPTIKVNQPLAQLTAKKAPVYVNTRKRPWIGNDDHARRGALSAFGFGGSNFHCVLEELEEEKTDIEWDGKTLLFAFSAGSRSALEAALRALDIKAPWRALRALAAESLQRFDVQDAYRLTLVVDQKTALGKLIDGAVAMLRQAEKLAWQTPDGAFFGSQEKAGKLAMLFPGQGSQYTNMLLDLACQFPQIQAALKQANTRFASSDLRHRLSDMIYPLPVFDEETAEKNTLILRDTRHAQPAMAAISDGAYHVLRHFSVKADALAGHSFGELTALCCADIFSAHDLHDLANQRGRLMQMGQGDQGAMLAVSASAVAVHAFIEQAQLELVIANHNAPTQLVLSGGSEHIARASALLSERGVKSTRLPVAAAFHSSYVAAAEQPFAELLRSVEFKQGKIPVYANATAQPYPDDVNRVRGLLARQLAQPVEFVSQIEQMYADGIDTFIEVGPGDTLTAFVKSILKDKAHKAIALDASKGRRSGEYDLASLLAGLAASGFPVDVTKWDEGYRQDDSEDTDRKQSLCIPVSGANYVKPRERRLPVAMKTSATQYVALGDTTTQTAAEKVTAGTDVNPLADVELLEATRQSILTLQHMQEQTARLHQQYLEGQQAAQQTIHTLIQQQQPLLSTHTSAAGSVLPVQPSAPVQQQAADGSTSSPPAQQQAADGSTSSSATTPEKAKADNGVAEDIDPGFYEKLLLEVVADKTGYPVEMLSMDMSLDTDLGIDSIKRVEILSAVQERLPTMTKIQPQDLGTFQLLTHIVEFLAEGTSGSEEASPPVKPAATQSAELEAVLLKVVADKTGYPVEMLSMDMSLDADLGIDSIKRVEILSALQERLPDLPTVNAEDLATLQTLKQILAFMSSPLATETPAQTEQPVVPSDRPLLEAVLLEVVADKTGYPVEMLSMDMSLDTDLGIDSIKRVEILSALQERLPDLPAVNAEDLANLHTLQQIIAHMAGGDVVPPPEATATIAAKGSTAQEQAIYQSAIAARPFGAEAREPLSLPEGALIWIVDDGTDLPFMISQQLQRRHFTSEIVSLDKPLAGQITGLIILAPTDADDRFVYDSFKRIKQAQNSGCLLLAGVTRFGGKFAFSDVSPARANAAGLIGMIKTLAKESAEVHCRAIDIPVDESEQVASQLVDAALLAGPVEIGVSADHHYALTLNTDKVSDFPKQDNPFSPGDRVIVTGGARGVTADVAVELAKTYKTDLLLLGRSPLPSPEPAWLQDCHDAAAIKQAVIEQSGGEAVALQDVERAYQEIIIAREIRHNLERIRETGVSLIYESVDVRDTTAVKRIVDMARSETGAIAGLIHGAGVICDKLIADKTLDQFDLVYSTKVAGLRSVLAATEQDPLKVIVMFSSSSGRFGRKGQADYAAANEVLNKTAQQLQVRRPDCRVISVNWGPLDGGMVTPQLKRVFESEGTGVIPLGVGARYLMNAIAQPGPVEVVISASAPSEQQTIGGKKAVFDPALRLSFQRQLSVDDYPILKSHVMNGKPVLPAALITEWLAHGAMHHHPGLSFLGFNDFRLFKGVVLEQGEVRPLEIYAGGSQMRDGQDCVVAELRGDNALHARAEIVLGVAYESSAPSHIEKSTGGYPYQRREYYGNGQLFHGKDLQSVLVVDACSEEGIQGRAGSAPAPVEWMSAPVRSTWIADPLLLDSAFQMMILWSFQRLACGSLPVAIGSYRQFTERLPKDGAQIRVRIKHQSAHSCLACVQIFDRHDELVAVMNDYECVLDHTLNEAFKNNTLSLDEKTIT